MRNESNSREETDFLNLVIQHQLEPRVEFVDKLHEEISVLAITKPSRLARLLRTFVLGSAPVKIAALVTVVVIFFFAISIFPATDRGLLVKIYAANDDSAESLQSGRLYHNIFSLQAGPQYTACPASAMGTGTYEDYVYVNNGNSYTKTIAKKADGVLLEYKVSKTPQTYTVYKGGKYAAEVTEHNLTDMQPIPTSSVVKPGLDEMFDEDYTIMGEDESTLRVQWQVWKICDQMPVQRGEYINRKALVAVANVDKHNYAVQSYALYVGSVEPANLVSTDNVTLEVADFASSDADNFFSVSYDYANLEVRRLDIGSDVDVNSGVVSVNEIAAKYGIVLLAPTNDTKLSNTAYTYSPAQVMQLDYQKVFTDPNFDPSLNYQNTGERDYPSDRVNMFAIWQSQYFRSDYQILTEDGGQFSLGVVMPDELVNVESTLVNGKDWTDNLLVHSETAVMVDGENIPASLFVESIPSDYDCNDTSAPSGISDGCSHSKGRYKMYVLFKYRGFDYLVEAGNSSSIQELTVLLSFATVDHM